jgi:hypothetical protein
MTEFSGVRALVCLNLRKEWVGDQRQIAAVLERQLWCLEHARQTGWVVFHAHEARRPAQGAAKLRGALWGMAPRRHEPVHVIDRLPLLANASLLDALQGAGATCARVIGFVRAQSFSAVIGGPINLRIISDAVCGPLGEESLISDDVPLETSAEAFIEPRADVVCLNAWRVANARAKCGAE